MIAFAAVAALLAAEALAFHVAGELVARLLPEPRNAIVAAPAFVAVACAAFLAPRAADGTGLHGRARAPALAAVALLVLYAALRVRYAGDLALWDFRWAAEFVTDPGGVDEWIPPVVVSAMTLAGAWARAAWRAGGEVWIENAPRSLAPAFGVVTVALAIAAASGEAAPIVVRGGVVFYAVALTALACAQLSGGGATIGGLRAGGVTLAMLAGVAVLALAGVLLIGVFLEPLLDALAVLADPARAVGRGVMWLLTWAILFPVGWLIVNFFEVLRELFGGGAPPEPALPEPPPEGVEDPLAAAADADGGLPRAGRYSLAALALVLGVGAVAGLALLIARLRRLAGDDAWRAAETERVGGIGGDLRDAARALFRRERRIAPSVEGVERLHLEVLEAARSAGSPRPPARTPREFAPMLAGTLGRAPVTDAVTDAYEQARYAGREPDADVLADLRRRWETRG